MDFKEVVTADKAANTKANGLWGKLVSFVMSQPASFRELNDGKAKAMSDFLKNREKEAREEDRKWQPSGAYRSNKSLILRAIRLSVRLTDSADQPRGKSDVQDTCNEIERKDVSPYEQFMAAINTVGKKLEKLEEGQRTSALAAIGALSAKARQMVTGEVQKQAA